MNRGLVVGELWAARKVPALEGRRLKLVAIHPAPSAADKTALLRAPLTVAIDTLDAANGQEVLVAYGSGARNVILPGPHNRHLLCDAAIALIVDGAQDEPAK